MPGPASIHALYRDYRAGLVSRTSSKPRLHTGFLVVPFWWMLYREWPSIRDWAKSDDCHVCTGDASGVARSLRPPRPRGVAAARAAARARACTTAKISSARPPADSAARSVPQRARGEGALSRAAAPRWHGVGRRFAGGEGACRARPPSPPAPHSSPRRRLCVSRPPVRGLCVAGRPPSGESTQELCPLAAFPTPLPCS